MSTPPADSRRLFFALWPRPVEREAWGVATAQLVAHTGGRAVPVENLHVTLAFLGPVAVERIASLRELGDELVLPPVTLVLECVGYFGGSRAVWLGPAEVPPELAAFEQRLWMALDSLGFRRDVRPFRPHLTLARRVRRPPRRTRSPSAISWPVSQWALVASATNPDGARYTPLAIWPAGGRTGANAGSSR